MIRTRLSSLALLAALAGLYCLSCDNNKDIPPLPPAPTSPGWLEILSVTDTSVTLRWQDLSNNELGFIVYLRTDSVWAARDTTSVNARQVTIGGLVPATPYGFRVTAYNEYGESAPTNVRDVTTNTPALPDPPTNVTVEPLSATTVVISWTGHDNPDSFVVQRRQPPADWLILGRTARNVEQYTDLTTVEQTVYRYRVGAERQTFVVWSDSVEIETPALGAPRPPDSLRIQVVLGVGVILTWRDRSVDEIRFDIKRGIAGLPDNIIASVPANTTTYTDTLTEIGFYYYRVRSANAFGESAWALPVEAEYRFCSDGLIPVCVGNYWEYDVDSADVHSSIRRRVAEDVTFLSGDDYYRIIQSPLFGGQPDSLYYLRNSIGQGTLMEKHPLPATPAPEIMFRYPTGVSGSYYYALGDCVVVLNAYPGISIPIRDTTYTGVVSYQRFFRNGRSIQYWIRPNDVGIVREVENRGGVPPVTIVREVMRYMILNQ